MIACVLAGGEGRRLRPLTAFTPKPMVEIADRPVLAHLLKRLAAAGVDRAAVTLQYLPDAVRDGIGDGSAFGVRLAYRAEERPLGTAGAVRACAELFGGEDVLVVSGDAVTAVDFAAALRAHRETGAAATLVLAHQSEPTEYGLVRVAEDGRIRGFVEKPGWDGVFTDLVNTGIYVLSAGAVARIPEGRVFDFARDLFPGMAAEGSLFGWETDAYWCDIGSPEAYLRCSADVLAGRAGIVPDAPERARGVRVADGAVVAAGAKLVPPVLVCAGASVGEGAVVGPEVVVGRGASVGAGAAVSGSVVSGVLGDGCEAEGAIVCRGGAAGACTVLRRGSIVGPGADTGRHSFVAAGAVLTENERLADGSVKRAGRAGPAAGADFEDGAVRAGAAEAFSLGAAAAELASGGRVLVGCAARDPEASAAAEAAAAGVVSAGGEALVHDAGFAAGGEALTGLLAAGMSLFACGGTVRVTGPGGERLSHGEEKKLMAGARAGAQNPRCGRRKTVTGAAEFLAAAAARRFRPERPVAVAVSGEGAAADAVRLALALAGCRAGAGGLVLTVSADGKSLAAARGETLLEPGRSAGAALLAAAALRPGATFALAPDAPAAWALALNRAGCAALRLGRDPGAEEAASACRVGRDAAESALALAAAEAAGIPLERLAADLPPYAVERTEVRVATPRAELMRRLTGSFASGPSGDGAVSVATRRGSASVAPAPTRAAIRIAAEAGDAETARAIAEDLAELVKKLDRNA